MNAFKRLRGALTIALMAVLVPGFGATTSASAADGVDTQQKSVRPPIRLSGYSGMAFERKPDDGIGPAIAGVTLSFTPEFG
jgi:hypothetical protein